MKRWRWLFVILVGLLALGVFYVFCIPCQFFEWMPMPSTSEILANPNSRPSQLVEISTFGNSRERYLCVHIKKAAFVKKSNHPSGMMFDLPNQIANIQESFNKSFQFFIDGWRKPVIYADLSGPFIRCADITAANQDQHLAHVQYNDLDGQAYSYTWMFEVKADGIVPEVTARVVP